MSEGNYWKGTYRHRIITRRLSRRRLLQVAGLGAAGALSASYLACGDDGGGSGGVTPSSETPIASGTPRRGGSLVYASNSDFASMDPAFMALGHDKLANYNVYEYPVTRSISEDGALGAEGLLAESYELLDETTIVLKFRQGIKFHDGTDFNAAAVKFEIDRVQNPETRATRSAELANIASAETTDVNTLRIVQKEPDAVGLTQLDGWALCIPSPAAVEKYGSDFQNNPVGTGPFVFKRMEKGTLYEFERNPNYWRKDEPYLDNYKVRIIPDKAVAAAAMAAGEVHGTWGDVLDPNDIVAFQNDPDFEVIIGGGAGIKRIYLHKGREPFNDIRFRRAMSMAIDREEIIAAHSGLAFVTPSPLPRHTAYDNPNEPDPEYNPEKAKQLLKDAGLEGVEITMMIISDPVDQADGELILAQLKRVGINVKLESIAANVVGAKAVAGEFTCLAMNFPTDFGGIDYAIRHLFYSKGVFNKGVTVDAEIDRLVDQSRTEMDINKRKEIYWEIQRISMENVYEISLIGLPGLNIFRKGFQGYVPLDAAGGPALESCFRRIWVSA